MGRRAAIVGTLLVALLAPARPSHAGILEIIWEMSGPQMLGIAYGCMFPLRTFRIDQCRVGSGTPTVTRVDKIDEEKKFLFALGAALLGSTGRDPSEDLGFDWGEIWMLEATPGVAYRSVNRDPDDSSRRLQLHHGAGVSWAYLFGRDIRGFDKFAFTVTPMDVVYKRVAVGFRLRLYPHGFTADEFKRGPRLTIDRPFEATWGLTFSIVLDRH